MTNKTEKPFINTFWFGFVGALLGLVLGFYFIGFVWALLNDTNLSFWVNEAFLDTPIYRTNVLTGSAILDIAAFFWLYPKGYTQTCKGILAVMILLVLTIAFFFMN